MYQNRRKITNFAPADRDESQRMTGTGGERPSADANVPATGVLSGAIAHGFDRELSTILNQLSAAMAELPSCVAAREHIVAALQAAERAGHLNRQLLANVGRERVDARPMDLNALIGEKVKFLDLDEAPNLTLRLELARSLPRVEGDPEQVQRAIGHLLTNAAEAIGTNLGTITVSTGTTIVNAKDAASQLDAGQPLAPGRYVTLEVSDDGCGMDDETRERISAPLFSTKGVGRGLGMTSVLGAVRGHGGGVEVASRPGHGTTVTLFFPITGERAAVDLSPSEPGEEAADNGDGRHCVLVIDDELDVREAVTDILAIEGLEVLTAAGGKDGLQLYRESAHSVDVVLLDLSMPKMGGAEVCRRLRELDPEVRVLMTSGYDRSQADRSAAQLQADGFLPKPYDMQTLVEAVFDLLDEEGSLSAS